METEKINFPLAAHGQIREIGLQIESLQAQLQRFVDGLILGLGIDVENNEISVDLSDMSMTITPKNQEDGRDFPPIQG